MPPSYPPPPLKGYLACEQGVLGMGDGRKEVRALCHEVGHLVLFLIYIVMVSFSTDLSETKQPFHLDENHPFSGKGAIQRNLG